MCNNPLKRFRTMTGADRRAAVRAHLATTDAIDFTGDPHSLRISQQCALADMARAVCWRKSPSSPLSLGMAFYVYLSRDAKPTSVQADQSTTVRTVRHSFTYGRGAA